MNYDKQAAFVAKLYNSTVAGKVAWTGGARKDAFEASFPRQSVAIWRESFTEDGADDDRYYVAVINRDGEVADEFSDRDLRSTEGAPYWSWYQTMRDLWQQARRRAHGADQVLDDLLDQLGDDE